MSGEGGGGSVEGWVGGRVGGGLVVVTATATAAEVAASAARSAIWSAFLGVGVRASGGWRLRAMREAMPAFSMASHAVSTAAVHGSGASSSTPVPVRAQVMVTSAVASSA